ILAKEDHRRRRNAKARRGDTRNALERGSECPIEAVGALRARAETFRSQRPDSSRTVFVMGGHLTEDGHFAGKSPDVCHPEHAAILSVTDGQIDSDPRPEPATT